ncbi:hypothetical protein [Streptomyces deccanensis]|uniref:glycine-rich domain-containing protein n=1 Tax=Streptomyces deccanensis TaxID=424188 RepID=UPI001EFADEE4|nr:hypothetical protein [Streptomyces deccanensis]ULR56368.1 hypothetical protein L3078_17870 [Streptomyces deccanensis]
MAGSGSSRKAHDFLRVIKGFTEANSASDVENRPIRLGRIDFNYDPADFLGGINPRVLFDGEKVVSQKRYTVMSGYYPLPGARVVLIPVGTTYMIIGAVDAAPQDPQVDIFTDNDTWDKTPGARMVRIQVQAGGGGGGGILSATNSGEAGASGGGGGGGYAESWLSANSVGTSETVTVGTGGAGGAAGSNNGTNGGDSSFGTLVVAGGGEGGIAQTAARSSTANLVIGGGVGGTGTTGDLLIQGDDGGNGRVAGGNVSSDGWGGGSVLGGQRRGVATVAGASGTSGRLYGGGGGGGIAESSTSAFAGGNGAAGIVIVTTYF